MKLTKAERLERQRERATKVVDSPTVHYPKIDNTPIEKPERPPLTPVPVEEWHGCYDRGWKDLITPESFAHPAKAGRNLLEKIYDHLFAIGALKRGASVVLDPFGGVGTTGIIGAWRGVQVICHELEEKFVTLARANFDLHMGGWSEIECPVPVILQGDSRRLRDSLRMARLPEGTMDAVVSSPPYIGGGNSGNQVGSWSVRISVYPKDMAGYGESDGQLGKMDEGAIDAVISSPPYVAITTGAGGLNSTPADGDQQGGRSADSPSQSTDPRYGESAGQLSRLSAGNVDAVISSPPYAETLLNDDQRQAGKGEPLRWGTNEEYGTSAGQLGILKDQGVDVVISSPPFGTGDSASAQSIVERTDKSAEWIKANVGSSATKGYGTSAGQMAQMKTEDVDAVISSPPFENSISNDPKGFTPYTGPGHYEYTKETAERRKSDYGQADGQLGKESGDTFWTAARDIVRECHAILKPGGYAVWIVKAFVRDKQIVDFPGDWRRLCEHIGFTTELEVHAMLVKTREYDNLFGDKSVDQKQRKSFFRRLAESKGSPKIDYEVVYFMRKK